MNRRIEWQHGATFPWLGEPVIVVLDPRHDFREAGAVLHTDTNTLPGVARHTLHVGLSQNAPPAQIRDAVQAWLMRQAKALFTERLNHYAPQLKVQWRKLTLSSAGTLWGTAHSDGSYPPELATGALPPAGDRRSWLPTNSATCA